MDTSYCRYADPSRRRTLVRPSIIVGHGLQWPSRTIKIARAESIVKLLEQFGA